MPDPPRGPDGLSRGECAVCSVSALLLIGAPRPSRGRRSPVHGRRSPCRHAPRDELSQPELFTVCWMITSYFLSQRLSWCQHISSGYHCQSGGLQAALSLHVAQSQIRGDWGRGCGREHAERNACRLHLSFLTFCLFLEEVLRVWAS